MRYQITSPEGKAFEVNAPDGARPEQVLAYAQAQFSKNSAPAAPSTPTAMPKPLTNDNPNPIDRLLIEKLSKQPGIGTVQNIQSSVPGRVIQGMADLPLGLMQLAANLTGFGSETNSKLAEINKRTEALRGADRGSFDAARLAGNVLNPVMLGALSKIPAVAGYIPKILQAAKIGAAVGASTPIYDSSNYAGDKAKQIASSAAISAAVPAVAPLVTIPAKAAYHGLVEPWMNPAAIKGRAYLGAAGDKVDEIIQNLRNPKTIVPGSLPTAGEAAVPAASAEFSALQKQATQIAPTPYVSRTDAQNAARIAALRTVGQDQPALDAAIAARSAAADPLYQAARQGASMVDATGVLRDVNKALITNPGNRELISELTNVRKGLVDARGNIRTNPQEISSVIDGLKTSIADEKNKFISGTLTDLKNKLIQAIPGYEKAQQVFAEKSAPINQMQIGKYLEKKLVPALSEDAKQKASVFAGAVQDAAGTIKRATGSPRFQQLTQALTPNQMGVVNSIKEDLARGARMDSLAQKGAKAAPDLVSAVGDHRLTGMFSRAVTIANSVISRLEGKVNKRLASEIAMEMLNPSDVAKSLAEAKKRAINNQIMARAVERSVQSGTAGALVAGQRK